MASADESSVFEWIAPHLPLTSDQKKAVLPSLIFLLALPVAMAIPSVFCRAPDHRVTFEDVLGLALITVVCLGSVLGAIWTGKRFPSRVKITEKGVRSGFLSWRFSELRYVRFARRVAQEKELEVLHLVTRRWGNAVIPIAPSIPLDQLGSFLAGKVKICHVDASRLEAAMAHGCIGIAGILGLMVFFSGLAGTVGGATLLARGDAKALFDPSIDRQREQVQSIEKELAEAGFTEEQVKALKGITWLSVDSSDATFHLKMALVEACTFLAGVVLMAIGAVLWLLDRGRVLRRRLGYMGGLEETRLLAEAPPKETNT
jgi:hypothetical protein